MAAEDKHPSYRYQSEAEANHNSPQRERKTPNEWATARFTLQQGMHGHFPTVM